MSRPDTPYAPPPAPDPADAARHYARAEALEPGNGEHRVKRMFAEARARDLRR